MTKTKGGKRAKARISSQRRQEQAQQVPKTNVTTPLPVTKQATQRCLIS